jgi:type IV fimbrial biogenesis protein FimT
MEKYISTPISNTQRQSGLTLVELMVATAILAIIASAAVPAMRDLLTSKNVKSISKHFDRSIRLARSEARDRSVNMRIKPTSNSADWSQGWHIEYTDDNNNVQIIKRFDALPYNPIFTSNTFNGANDLIITGTGQAQTVGSFDFYYPGCTGNERYTFNLLLSGMLSKGVSACP